MGWCPKCKTEYENFVTLCKECNKVLVQSLDEVEDNSDIKYIDDIVLKELITVDSLIEAERIINMLEVYSIYATYKQKGSGEYLQIASGINYYGITIYVQDCYYKRALSIIEDEDDNKLHIEEYEDEAMELGEKKFRKRKRTFFIILICLTLIIPIIIIAAQAIFTRIFL
jgi:thiol-disulfide isomerase/thioredoxin